MVTKEKENFLEVSLKNKNFGVNKRLIYEIK
jgi:hypothetical protein